MTHVSYICYLTPKYKFFFLLDYLFRLIMICVYFNIEAFIVIIRFNFCFVLEEVVNTLQFRFISVLYVYHKIVIGKVCQASILNFHSSILIHSTHKVSKKIINITWQKILI